MQLIRLEPHYYLVHIQAEDNNLFPCRTTSQALTIAVLVEKAKRRKKLLNLQIFRCIIIGEIHVS